MRPTAFLLLAAVHTVISQPVENQKREVGGVLMCTGANATGTCHYEVYPLETCQQLSEPFFQNTKTFAPDGESFQCYPRAFDCDGICRSPTGCTFGKVTFDYENKYDLSAIKWDTLIQSFDCIEWPPQDDEVP